MKIDIPKKDLFRPEEVSKLLTVSRATIYRWLNEGRLPYVRIAGRLIRVQRTAILEIISDK